MKNKYLLKPLKVELNAPLAVVPGHFIKTDDDVESPIALLWEGGGTYGKPQQIAYAHLFAAAPQSYALIARAVANRIDDEWLKDARKYLSRVKGVAA